MIKCPNCGRQNDENAQYCIYCGAILTDVVTQAATRNFDDIDYEEGAPKWGAARFGGKMGLRIDVVETGQYFLFNADQLNEIVLGRVNPDTGEAPEVDLTDSGALDKGVSRHHASIIAHEGAVYIVDNASANGTFLNGQRLVANQPRILRDGDDIRLGHLVVRITFLNS